MSKAKVALSIAAKQLIALRGAPTSSQCNYDKLAKLLDSLHSASQIQTSRNALLTLATGTLFAINAPQALRDLWQWTGKTPAEATLMRESGLKCISFIGIASVINNLGVLHECFTRDDVSNKLEKHPRRVSRPENIRPAFNRGRQLWDSIYQPHQEKLISKLGEYHPDLPVHILESHYSLLLSDPDPAGPLGRTLTSVLAIACLQGQSGVGSQATSHVFGLKKALLDEDAVSESASRDLEGLSARDRNWLCGDIGTQWILESIEALRSSINGSSDAVKAKL